ncbi:DUF4244 domain-containing protein [Rothia kristinae]|uniref:DUF4244 domain-containing protein n=1 Tax=Rothia kristinae TaxID=37923 RepID=A0A7T4T489_9MICC|nr:DUF4244 domain-containing protein [Rothia kristinae]QQC59000.1 DUF4244 domain-containing protein [Rothia kristinae]
MRREPNTPTADPIWAADPAPAQPETAHPAATEAAPAPEVADPGADPRAAEDRAAQDPSVLTGDVVRHPGRAGADDPELGATTAEYGIVMLAAVGFAGLLVVILKSGEVKELLMGIIRTALSTG